MDLCPGDTKLMQGLFVETFGDGIVSHTASVRMSLAAGSEQSGHQRMKIWRCLPFTYKKPRGRGSQGGGGVVSGLTRFFYSALLSLLVCPQACLCVAISPKGQGWRKTCSHFKSLTTKLRWTVCAIYLPITHSRGKW